MMHGLGKIVITVGIIITIAGIFIFFFGNKLSWLGKLPGDIRIKTEYSQIYIPITTMILVSIVISFLMWLLRKI